MDNVIDDNWDNSDFQSQKAATVMRNMTKDEFTNVMESGYNLISMAACFSIFYVIVAIISTYYTAKTPVRSQYIRPLQRLIHTANLSLLVKMCPQYIPLALATDPRCQALCR